MSGVNNCEAQTLSFSCLWLPGLFCPHFCESLFSDILEGNNDCECKWKQFWNMRIFADSCTSALCSCPEYNQHSLATHKMLKGQDICGQCILGGRKITLAYSWGVCIWIWFTWLSAVRNTQMKKKSKKRRISWNSKAESSRGSTMFGWCMPSVSACVSLIITSCVRKWKERWNKEGLSYHQRLTRGHMSESRSHDSNTQPLASQKGTLELFLSWLWDLVCSTLKILPSQEEID